jgi:DNA-binding beta-propeller fold protein YncE
MFASSWFRPASKRPRLATRPAIEQLEDRCVPSAGGDYLLVNSYKTDNVLRFDAATGAFVDEFIPHRDGRLNQPWGVVIGPRDHDVYVSTGHFQGSGQIKAVLHYDGATGAFLDEFVQRGQMYTPHAVIFGPDGNLYVGVQDQSGQGRIARFDGTTGAYLNDFVPPGSGGLGHPVVQVFGPSGRNPSGLDLYVSDERTGSILRYDGTTGAFLGVFVPHGSGGLGSPTGLVFGPDGYLYVSDSGFFGSPPVVLRFQGPAGPTPGAFLGAFVPAGSGGQLQPFGLLFGPDRNGDGRQDLYVTSAEVNDSSFVNSKPHSSSVKVYDGVTGAYLSDFISVDTGGLNTPTLMTFTETDPVTLAYTGRGSIAAATAPLASSTPSAAATAPVHGGGQALFTDPSGASFPFTFMLGAVLRSDGPAQGTINFIFSPAFGQSWGAVPGVTSAYLTAAASSVAADGDGPVTLEGRLTEKDYARGGGAAFIEKDVPCAIALRPGAAQFTLQWCELPAFDLEPTDGNLAIL